LDDILGAISAVATAKEPGEIFCYVNNARFYRFPVGQISQNLNNNTSIGVAIKILGKEFENFTVRGRFSKKHKNL